MAAVTASEYAMRTEGLSTPFEAVMSYLHSINMTIETKRSVGHQLMDEARREDAGIKMREQFRLKKDLEYFSTFQENWDGEGGQPLHPEAIHNFESLLPFLSSRCLLQIDVCPENNGSLLVMWRTKEAGINIGKSSYTYYLIGDNGASGESHLPFNVDDVLEKAESLAN